MRATDYQILLIENDPAYADFFINMINMPGREQHKVSTVGSLRDGLNILRNNTIDIICLDLRLPEIIGTKDLDQITTFYPEMPVVILTEIIDLEFGKKLLERGAQEYLIKGEFNRPQLFAIIQSAVERQKIRNILKEERLELADLANQQAIQFRESEAKFQAICDSAIDGIMLLDNSNQIVYWNKTASTLFGFHLATQKSIEFDRIIDVGEKEIRKEQSNGTSNLIRTIGHHKDGHEIPLELTINPVLINNELHTLVIVRDISEILQRDRELGKSREAFSSIVEHNKDGIVVTDIKGTVLFANQRTLDLLDIHIDELIGHPFEFHSSHNKETEVEINTNKKRKILNLVSSLSVWDGEMALTISMRDVTAYKELLEEQVGLITELKSALNEIKALRGIIPICSHCKSVRDDQGIWNRIEEYIADRNPEVDFSHGICEICLVKHYPDEIEDT